MTRPGITFPGVIALEADGVMLFYHNVVLLLA